MPETVVLPNSFFHELTTPSVKEVSDIPAHVRTAFAESAKYFDTPLSLFQFLDKYSRFNYDLGRRETWQESIQRAIDFLKELSQNKLPKEDYDKLQKFMLERKVAPSMRLLAMAGEAAQRDNTCVYNCSAVGIDSIDTLVEELFVSMSGCGIGFSVQKKYIDKFPLVKPQIGLNGHTPIFIVPDSTNGWAKSFKLGLEAWFSGMDIKFDYSLIRAAGSPLKIKGGTASGPLPLKNLLEFTRKIILARQNKKLRPLDVHDILCKLGETIVAGGVRRSALISLFDIDDVEMRECKNGENIIGNEQRYMANNSSVWEGIPSDELISKQMDEMNRGMRGEPGIFSQYNANHLAPKRRQEMGYQDFLTNPCGEVTLRSAQFCNLSQAIIRANDTEETLKEKVEVAAILGTIQACATYFPYLSKRWKENTELDALLGTDLNGQCDNILTQPANPDRPRLFTMLKEHAVAINKKYAQILGIRQSSSVTVVKPNGNSGILYNCASGLHPRWSKYYIRNARVQAQSPLAKLFLDQGVPMSPENGQTWENASTFVIHFPVKSPEGALTRHDLTALQQCENWLVNKKYWTEMNPSVTITYKPDEFENLKQWVIKNKNWVGGMSFLPASNAQYKNMPYEEIDEALYNKLSSEFPLIDFSQLVKYESTDLTTASQELSCVSGACSLDDLYAHQSSPQLVTIS